jgi:LacI family transcriptional regulator
MRELIQRSIDGMIISPCNVIEELIPILGDTHIPVVFADRPGDDKADFVGIDNAKEAQKLIRSFSKKPKRLAIISEHAKNVSTIEKRIQGATKACIAEKIEYEIIKLPETQMEINKLIEAARKNGADSFLPLNNMVVFKVLAALKQLRISIPKDVRLISFDDQEAFQYMEPAISALNQPIYHIGKESVDRLVERLKETKTPGKHLLLSCEFLKRGSH